MAVEFQWSALNPLPQKGGKYIIYMKISEIFLINWKCRNLIKQCYTQYFLNSSYFLRSFTQILSGERTFSLFFFVINFFSDYALHTGLFIPDSSQLTQQERIKLEPTNQYIMFPMWLGHDSLGSDHFKKFKYWFTTQKKKSLIIGWWKNSLTIDVFSFFNIKI